MKMQITMDSTDPHALVEFWASALGYTVEDHTAVIDGLLAAGRLPAAAVREVRGGKGFVDLAACSDPSGRQPRLLLQRVPEAKSVKNRQHLDLQFGPAEAPAEIERLVGLGASVAWVDRGRGPDNTTLRDPEGNEFCVS